MDTKSVECIKGEKESTKEDKGKESLYIQQGGK